MNAFTFVASALVILFSSNSVQASIESTAPDYATLFPRYVEACALTQKEKLGEAREEDWGHIMMFLRGACRDESKGFPQLRVCDPVEGSGVTVSVNSLTKNVNWIATEGEAFGFYGTLKPGDTLNESNYMTSVQHGIDTGIFNGVTIHEDRIKPEHAAKWALPEILVRSALDIDTAITFGRDAHCARMPLTEERLTELVDVLNKKNQVYLGEKPYRWSALYNNCAHLVHNSLAALGFWEAKKTDAGWGEQVFNLAVPANGFIEVMDLGNGTALENPVTIFRNPFLKKMLLEKNWLPARHGVLSRNFAHWNPNELYAGDLSIFIFEPPFSSENHQLFKKYTTEPLYQDLKTNLIYWRAKYVLAINRTEIAQVSGTPNRWWNTAPNNEYKEFLSQYLIYLKDQLHDVDSKLQLLEPPQ